MLFSLLYTLPVGPLVAARLVCSCLLCWHLKPKTKKDLQRELLLPVYSLQHCNNTTHYGDVNIVC